MFIINSEKVQQPDNPVPIVPIPLAPGGRVPHVKLPCSQNNEQKLRDSALK